jgi:hypothetical protein
VRTELSLDINRKLAARPAFVPLRPLMKVEHVFAHLGRWRRLSRCYDGTVASAETWLEVAAVGHLAWRAANRPLTASATPGPRTARCWRPR